MRYILFIAFLLIISACSNENSTITIQDKFVSESLKNADNTGTSVVVSLRYPEITASDKNLETTINKAINDFILAPVYENDHYQKPDDMVNSVFNAYKKLVNEFPDYKLEWQFKRDAKVVYKSDKIVTLDFTEIQFTGGAHPLEKKEFFSFDVENAAELTIDEVIDTTRPIFMELAEAKFREFQGIAPDVNLADADYFPWNGGEFILSESFGIIGEDIIFYYNPYDIAPYYKGSSKFMLNKKDLGNMLKRPELLD